jgi:deferrochelatase/peroxidase EfeB
VESFSLYYEKFSLNPRNWFPSKEEREKIIQNERMMRDTARKNAHIYIPKLKQILKSQGYSIHRNEFAYTTRKDRKVGLSFKDAGKDKTKYKDPVLNIAYIKTLFTLAHEVGHVLQWDNDTDTKVNFNEFYESQVEAEKENPYKRMYIA